MIFGCTEMDKSYQEPLPDIVTYDSQIKAILDQSCVRCHGGPETRRNLDLSNYNEIKQLIDNDVSGIIIPGNSFSTLLRKTTPEGSMYIYLNDHRDYELLEQWIVIDSTAEN